MYRLDPVSQELKKLPDEQWKQTGSIYDVIIGVSGASSSVRVKAGEKTEFAFKTGSPENVSLYRFVQKKNKREFQVQKLASKLRGA